MNKILINIYKNNLSMFGFQNFTFTKEEKTTMNDGPFYRDILDEEIYQTYIKILAGSVNTLY